VALLCVDTPSIVARRGFDRARRQGRDGYLDTALSLPGENSVYCIALSPPCVEAACFAASMLLPSCHLPCKLAGMMEPTKPWPTARRAMTLETVGCRHETHMARTLVRVLCLRMVCIVWQGEPQGAPTTTHQLRPHAVLHRTDLSFGVAIHLK
jgi:hypothetical protein